MRPGIRSSLGLLAFLYGLAAAPCAATAEGLAARGTFRVLRKRDHLPLCTANWEVRSEGDESVFLESGQGSCHGYKEAVSWYSETRADSADPSQLHTTYRKIFTIDRSVLLKTSSRQFDPQTGVVTAKVVHFPGQEREQTDEGRWSGYTGIATPTSLLFVIRAGLEHDRIPGKVSLVTSEPAIYTLRYVRRRRDQVTVPGGAFDCVKIELLVDVGVLNFLRPLLPKFYVWYTNAPPYHWVKYEGLEDGLGSPRVIIERTSPITPIDSAMVAPPPAALLVPDEP